MSLREEIERARAELKDFLSKNLYHHPRVARVVKRAERILTGLFGIYRSDPGRLPSRVVARFDEDGESRAVADYLAGMTDRFAFAEHGRFFPDDAG